MAALLRSRSVSNGPGSRLLIVTPRRTVLRARPATKPVSPERAPFDKPRMSMGAFTALEVMFTIRPKPRSIMLSTVALISSMGGQHVGLKRPDPVLPRPVAEVARGWPSGVVDQNV